MYNLLSAWAIDGFLPIAKWLAIGIVGLAFLFSLITLIFKKEEFIRAIKIMGAIAFITLLAIGVTCLIMEIGKSFSLEEVGDAGFRAALVKYLLIPICILLFLLLSSGVAIFIVAKKSTAENSAKNTALALKVCGAVNLMALIACGVMLALYYKDFGGDSANQAPLYIAAVLVIIAVVALAFILDGSNKSLDTRCIALAGICIAMSFGLSYIKLFEMPQGGSITLFSLLPVMIFSTVYGSKKGVLVCFIYGVLQAVQDPWLLHPAQFLLDYPVAFAAIGLSGAFAGLKGLNSIPQISFLLGGILASSVRFICHVFSGVFAFATYAGDMNPWIYSLGYNSFVFVDMAITVVVGVLLFSSKAFVKELKKNA